MATPKRSSLGTQLQMNFLTYTHVPRHILEFGTTEEHNKREIWVVGRSGCGLTINMKYARKGTNAAKNSDYFPACNAVSDVKNRGKRQYALEWEAVARPQQGTRAEKITSKLGLGLNFAVNVDFWVCNKDFNKKNWRQKHDFCCFSMMLKTVIFVVVKIQPLIFCKNR